MSYLRTLYIKELKAERSIFYIVGGILIILPLYLLTRVGVWDSGRATMASYLPITFLVYIFFWHSYCIVLKEWSNRTSSLFASLPVRGELLLGAKVLIVWTQLLLFLLLVVGGFTLISRLDFAAQPNNLTFTSQQGLQMVTLIFVTLLPLTPMIILVFLSGTSFSRWSTMVRIVTAIALYILVILGSVAIARVVDFSSFSIPIPEFRSYGSATGDTGAFVSATYYPIAIPAVYYVVSYITGLGCFVYAARLLETRSHS